MAHPRGRQPIGVNQPPSGGSSYPLIRPSDDVKYLLGDFYLSYEDDRCVFEYPFYLVWLHGFGDNPVSPPAGWSIPAHSYDLIVHDKNGEVVFDSTTAISFNTTNWPATNPRLQILEWIADDAVCRATVHTEWTAADIADGLDLTYDAYIIPDNAELDSRTLNKLPKRVRSLRVGLTKLQGSPIIFDSGFNIDWQNIGEELSEFQLDFDDFGIEAEEQQLEVTLGRRVANRITIDAVPGAGLGIVPGCEETAPVVRKVSGAVADPSGNLTLDMSGCLKVQRPVTLTASKPREFRYAALGLTVAEAKAAIELGNGCGPCCQCDYFVRTYNGLARQWDLWETVAIEATESRDTLTENIERWTDEKSCRENNPLKLILIAEAECKVAVGVLYCNVNDCCARPLVLRFTFQYFEGGTEVTPQAYTCSSAEIDGSPQKRADIPKGKGEAYSLAGQWPVYEARFEYADPQDTSRVSFRICLPQCVPGNSLRMWVSAHYPDMGESPAGELCTSGVIGVPAEIEAIWNASAIGAPVNPARAVKTTSNIPLNAASAFCETCKCPTEDESQSQ